MNSRNDWVLTLATPEDSPGIQNIFDDDDFKGSISVKYNRAPDPYRSFQNDGDYAILPVLKDTTTNEILACGGIVIRKGYVNGVVHNTGYLTGLKILQSHQHRVNCIKQAYQLIGEQTTKYNPFYYTTILKSNKNAIKLLEKRRKGMPPYIYLGEYTVFCLGTGGRTNNRGYTFCRGHTEKLMRFYEKNLPKFNLAPANERLFGLDDNDFYYLQSPSGVILAACAVWNQQSYKQYIISGYEGFYKALSHIPTGRFGYPTMPKSGAYANYASIAALVIPEENRNITQLFLKLVLNQANKYDFLMLGLFENHPLMDAAQKMKHIKYQSRMYAVDYAGNMDLSGGLDGRSIMLEVGLL